MYLGKTGDAECILATRNADVYKIFGGETKREGLQERLDNNTTTIFWVRRCETDSSSSNYRVQRQEFVNTTMNIRTQLERGKGFT
jgi:hypothetical protein